MPHLETGFCKAQHNGATCYKTMGHLPPHEAIHIQGRDVFGRPIHPAIIEWPHEKPECGEQ